MAIEAETKDCTQLSDSELEEMAELCADGPSGYGIGLLSKQTDAWVLVTLVRNNGKGLQGFSFCTLERIGGTPSVIIGLASVKRNTKRDTIQRAIMGDTMRRAVRAFPDEDVLVGTRIATPGGFEVLENVDDIVPRPDYKPSGEDRAWGKRLAKRFGVDPKAYGERSFQIKGDGEYPEVFDHESLKPDEIDPEIRAMAADLRDERGDSMVVFGWALAEDLDKLA